MVNFVLDSYAVLAPLTDDVGADEVREVITNPEHRFRMDVVNPGEVHYVLSRTNGDEAVEDAVRLVFEQENVDVVDVSRRSSRVAVGCPMRMPLCARKPRARGGRS